MQGTCFTSSSSSAPASAGLSVSIVAGAAVDAAGVASSAAMLLLTCLWGLFDGG